MNEKYDEQKHINLLKKTLEKGESIALFCKKERINRRTFDRWKLKHKAFKETYDIYINAAEVIWENLPLKLIEEGKTFNFQHWYLIMRNRFKYSPYKLPNLKNKTIEEKFKIGWQLLADGSLTLQEQGQFYSNIEKETITTVLRPLIERTTALEEKFEKVLETLTTNAKSN